MNVSDGCISPSTKTTNIFYTGESDVEDGDCKIGDLVTNRVSQNVENEEEGAVSTLEAKILELDSIGFDETLLPGQSLDN
jgi:hypothetical protein